MHPVLATDKATYLEVANYPDLAIPSGKTTFITGDSGVGKSTLLKLFNNTVSPTAGRILYQGKNLADCDPILLRREVLLVSQSLFLWDKSIKDNFAEYHGYRDQPPPAEAEISEYLRICQADFPLDSPCRLLSGGEQQRVFNAIFLSFKPRVLMFDEPTAALDEDNARNFFRRAQEYAARQAMTLVAVSHDCSLADSFAGHIIRLEKRHANA